MNNERTAMTNEYLAKCDVVLENIKLACKEVCSGCSWNKACEKHGIDPSKARNLLLKTLPNCAKLEPLDETLLEDAYDGSWYAYRDIFGCYDLENHSLPYDYEESVDHVLKTLDSEHEDIARRHYGLSPYGEKQCYREIAEDHGMTESKARKMLQDALHSLRNKKTREILVYGLSKYQVMQENARKEHEAELARIQTEHDVMMEKRRREHEQIMEKMENSTFSEAVEILSEGDYAKALESTPIAVMGLSVRAYNALRRNNAVSMYDVIMAGHNGLKKMWRMGRKSIEEVEKACSRWTEENLYGMSPSEVKDKIKKKEVSV